MDIQFEELNVQLCVEWLKDIQLIHHARPTAAIRAGRSGESDVGEAPGLQAAASLLGACPSQEAVSAGVTSLGRGPLSRNASKVRI